MSLSDHEQEILNSIKRYEYDLPRLKSRSHAQLLGGVSFLAVGAVAYGACETIDVITGNRFGIIPETFGLVSGGILMSIGTIGVLAAMKDGAAYFKGRYIDSQS